MIFMLELVVVPIYFLVWYNQVYFDEGHTRVVVPIYFLVWYNLREMLSSLRGVVVPIYFLVWYNLCWCKPEV